MCMCATCLPCLNESFEFRLSKFNILPSKRPRQGADWESFCQPRSFKTRGCRDADGFEHFRAGCAARSNACTTWLLA